jgi:phosphocarrier protein
MNKGVNFVYTEKTIVKCESGLHNKQAISFIQKANEFRSSIWVEADDRKINAKSLLGVMSMGITTGTEISLIADGSDEVAAVQALAELLERDVY